MSSRVNQEASEIADARSNNNNNNTTTNTENKVNLSNQIEIKRILRSKTHYETLNINKVASESEVKNAFRRFAKLVHPDRNNCSQESNEAFQKLSEAQSVLIDSKLRRQYDSKIAYENYRSYNNINRSDYSSRRSNSNEYDIFSNNRYQESDVYRRRSYNNPFFNMNPFGYANNSQQFYYVMRNGNVYKVYRNNSNRFNQSSAPTNGFFDNNNYSNRANNNHNNVINDDLLANICEINAGFIFAAITCFMVFIVFSDFFHSIFYEKNYSLQRDSKYTDEHYIYKYDFSYYTLKSANLSKKKLADIENAAISDYIHKLFTNCRMYRQTYNRQYNASSCQKLKKFGFLKA